MSPLQYFNQSSNGFKLFFVGCLHILKYDSIRTLFKINIRIREVNEIDFSDAGRDFPYFGLENGSKAESGFEVLCTFHIYSYILISSAFSNHSEITEKIESKNN